MSTMKALVSIEGQSAAIKDIPIPKPGAGEILVKVHYVAQNPTDWKTMSGVPPGRIIGCDFAGTIQDANGSQWTEGQRVSGFVQGGSEEPIRGAFAEYTVVESSLVYAIPDSVSYQDASVIPLPFATAVQALVQRLKIPTPSAPATKPFPILINGGTSSVGKYAVQLAKLANLFVVATASKRNHALLHSYGVDAVVDYSNADWPEEVRKITNNDLVYAFDCIGEVSTIRSVAKALSSTEPGHIITLLPRKTADVAEVNSKVKVESTIVYTVFERVLSYGAYENCGTETPQDKAEWEKWLAALPDLLTSGKIKPNQVKEFGGINDILTGFKLQQEGKVSAEKLVYKIAS